MPVLWVESKFRITPDLAATLRIATAIPSIGHTIAAIIFFTGLVMILLTFGCRNNSDDIIEKDTNKEISSIEFQSTKSKDIS